MTPQPPARSSRPVLEAIQRGAAGILPPRYESDNWNARFLHEIEARMPQRAAILDVGGGVSPSLAPERRPSGAHYVGLDLSAAELEAAPEGSYDETLVADVCERLPQLDGRFDVVVSWLVLEHVPDLEAALKTIRRALAPGGHLVAQLAGGRSPFGRLNRLIPHRLVREILPRLGSRPRGSVFPAHYDRCWYSALEQLGGEAWAEWSVRPLYTAAGYFEFSRLLTALYLGYEERAYRADRREVAPYYLITGRAR